MDHRLDRHAGEHGVQAGAVQQVNPVEDQRPARELLDPAQRLLLAVAQIVHDGDLMAGTQQFQAGVAADVAGAPGDENLHVPPDVIIRCLPAEPFGISHVPRCSITLYRTMLRWGQKSRYCLSGTQRV